jgi:uncharacterized protein (TIGR03382 family)
MGLNSTFAQGGVPIIFTGGANVTLSSAFNQIAGSFHRTGAFLSGSFFSSVVVNTLHQVSETLTAIFTGSPFGPGSQGQIIGGNELDSTGFLVGGAVFGAIILLGLAAILSRRRGMNIEEEE